MQSASASALGKQEFSRTRDLRNIRAGIEFETGAILDPVPNWRRPQHEDLPAEHRAESTAFVPTRVCQVELSQGVTAILPADVDVPDRRYGQASVLVRLHGRPLGSVMVGLGDVGVSAPALAAVIDADLGPTIAEHLRDDGLDDGEPLTEAGLPDRTGAPCVARQRTAAGLRTASVVITTRDRTTKLELALRSVFAMEHEAFDVVVVDNVPSDDFDRGHDQISVR